MALVKMRFLKYNNYINRVVKRHTTLSGYSETHFDTPDPVSFNPGDGVDTYGIEAINWTQSWTPDYVVVYNPANSAIQSRWFVIEFARTKGGQYKMQLHRDLIVDNWDKVKSAPCFVEKATLPAGSPLIYNQEDMTLNQIKQSETLLKDSSGIAWICGYIDRNDGDGDDGDPTVYGVSIPIDSDVIPDVIEDNFSDWSYYPAINNAARRGKIVEQSISVRVDGVPRNSDERQNIVLKYDNVGDTWSGHDVCELLNLHMSQTDKDDLETLMDSRRNASHSGEYVGASGYANVVAQDGKIIFARVPSLYRKVHQAPGPNTVTVTSNSSINTIIERNLSAQFITIYSITYNMIRIVTEGAVLSTLVPLDSGSFTVTIPVSGSRLHLKDAPYDMFCIPYGSTQIRNGKDLGWTNLNVSEANALSMAQGIAKALGRRIFDLQLLPYCPMTGFNYGNGYIDINTSDSKRYTIINRDTAGSLTPYSIMLWATASSGSITIPMSISVGNAKIESQTDVARLVSPNYNGTFEFNVAKNGGLTGVSVYYTYLPYNPFIQINPIYGGIYGSNYADARGLCLQGDFSICYLSDPWIEYQISNKNYQNIFNRQMENLEVQQRYARREDSLSAIAGTFGGAAAGAALGGKAGPLGGAIGAIGGGTAAALTGIADMSIKEGLRNEAIDFTKDQFGYSLGNVKALPNSIAKTTAYNQINKIFPILELYSCTDEEKLALASKIKYNGMTVMVIGTLSDYIGNTWSYTLNGQTVTAENYVKGKMIRTSVSDDYHMANAISEEIYKGVYVKI